MRAVLQRVQAASVDVDGERIASIAAGLLILLGVGKGDGDEECRWIARKITTLRLFADDASSFARSLIDVQGEALVVSQFTLFGEVKKGRRPSFSRAMQGDVAEVLYQRVAEHLRAEGVATQCGLFGADMQLSLVNDGPVTVLLESPTTEGGRQ